MSSRKPFCNMCFKAGKSEREYTSHWLRDRPGPNGVVTCPYLLSIECRYCHAKGHTVTHCPVLAKKNKQVKQNHTHSVLPPLGTPPPLVMPTKKVNNPKPVAIVEPKQVAIVEPKQVAIVEPKPVAIVEPKQVAIVEPKQVAIVEPKPAAIVEPILGKRKFTPRMSWADMCDSDSDDEF